MKWNLKKVKVSDLKENPNNPRKLTEKGLKDLEKSIKEIDLNFYNIKQGSDLATYFQSLGLKRKYFNIKKLHPNKVCNTITKLFSAGMCGILHWKEKRYLTINELKRLSSFPDDFIFIGKFREQWARIGNAVMPNQMYHIAKHLKENVFKKV